MHQSDGNGHLNWWKNGGMVGRRFKQGKSRKRVRKTEGSAMATKTSALLILGLSLLLAVILPAQQQKPEDVPDAPSATRPIRSERQRVRQWPQRLARY